jgi:hypothetical protein
MIMIPENGADDQHSLTNVPYFDVTSRVTSAVPVDIVQWALDADAEYQRLHKKWMTLLAVDVTTKAFFVSQSHMKALNDAGRYEVTIHADMVRTKAHALPYQQSGKSTSGGLRGSVVGFSRKSRKRLIEKMASIRFDGDMLFLSLTYPDVFPSSPETWLLHFEAFRRRLERMCPRIAVIWRKELKERKSGQFQGRVAPHYHLLLYMPSDFDRHAVLLPDGKPIVDNPDVKLNPDERRQHTELSALLEGWALAHWSEIVASGDIKHEKRGAHCAPVRSKRHAYSYASKYLAKENDDDFEVGRRWGVIGNFDTSAFMRIRLTKAQIIEAKRMMVRLLKSRGSSFSRRLSRMSPEIGWSVFGLGDETHKIWADGFDSTVMRIIMWVKYHY